MPSSFDDPLQKYKEEYRRRAVQRSFDAHDRINLAAAMSLLEDLEGISNEQTGASRFGAAGRFVKRLFAGLPLPSHQPEDIFSLSTMPPASNWLANRNMPSYEDLPLTRAEKRSAVEARKQLQVIEQERRKTIAAIQAAAEIQHSGFTTFVDTGERMWAVCSAPGRDKELQFYIDAYFDRSIKKTGAYLEMVSDQGVGAIAATVSRSTYVDYIEATILPWPSLTTTSARIARYPDD